MSLFWHQSCACVMVYYTLTKRTLSIGRKTDIALWHPMEARMDYYPQPRPVLYGTSAEDAPPQTQTAPGRVGPPRWPPAPPYADFGDNPDESSGRPAPFEFAA